MGQSTSKVPEGHHPRGTTLREALRGKLPLRGLCGGLSEVGACAMTTEFLDNKICSFKILLSWRFPRKTASWTIFRFAPPLPPPPKTASFIFIVVSPSLKRALRGLSAGSAGSAGFSEVFRG